jgi:hypothetical protein
MEGSVTQRSPMLDFSSDLRDIDFLDCELLCACEEILFTSVVCALSSAAANVNVCGNCLVGRDDLSPIRSRMTGADPRTPDDPDDWSDSGDGAGPRGHGQKNAIIPWLPFAFRPPGPPPASGSQPISRAHLSDLGARPPSPAWPLCSPSAVSRRSPSVSGLQVVGESVPLPDVSGDRDPHRIITSFWSVFWECGHGN